MFYTSGAKTTPSSSKRRSKCTNSVDPFPILRVLHDGHRGLCVLHAHPFPVVFDGIIIIFGLNKASVTIRNKYTSGQVKSHDAVAADVQMTGAEYCISSMGYTGNGLTELVHFERRFEGEGVVLALLI